MRKREEFADAEYEQHNHSDGERRDMTQYHVEEVQPLGYGNPDADISLDRKLENGDLHPPAVEKGAEIIGGGECMTAITDPDDGCIDGRIALMLLFPSLRAQGDFEEVDITDPYEHKRAKVAGGGYMTAQVMKLALDPHITNIDEDLEGVAEHLTRQGIFCGVHTGPCHGEGSVGCGANDQFDVILGNLEKYAPEINQSIKGILPRCNAGVEYREDIEKASNDGVKRTLAHAGYFDGSSGSARFDVLMDRIAKTQQEVGGEKPLSVSKHLGGGHNEAFIVINTVPGKTFSQAAFKQKLKEAFPDVPEDKLPQAFVIDVPRIVELARAMAKDRPDEEEAFQIALHAGLGFQFAAAATLTDGSLRNFIVSEAGSPDDSVE